MKTIAAACILAVTALGIYAHHTSHIPTCEDAQALYMEIKFDGRSYEALNRGEKERVDALILKCTYSRAAGGAVL